LLALFDSVYVAALAAWVGSSLFVSFGMEPIIFKVLGGETGAKLIRSLLPRYYLWGALASAVALPAFVAGPLCYHEYRGPMVAVQALVIVCGILLMLYGGNSLAPAMNEQVNASPAAQGRFDRLNRRARRLNAIASAIGLALLVGFVTRPAPRTSGIIEMTPAERSRYDAAIGRVIHDVEARYGIRPPGMPAGGESGSTEPLIDAGTVEEIEAYYAEKHRRDLKRAGRQRGSRPESAGHETTEPAPLPSRSGSQPAAPASSGGPRFE
jgi:hypothetical protein